MQHEREAHVFIFPLPVQGPVNCMLKLAEILSINQIKVTFLNTDYIHQRLITHTDAPIRFRNYPDFCFRTVPDGLPEENPRTSTEIGNLLESMDASAAPIFREMLLTAETPVTCLIADGVFAFATDVAAEIGVPLLYFDTVSPCGFWTLLCLPKLIQAGEVPFKDGNLDEMITNVPGMEGIIRRRDLPSFCRTNDINDRRIRLILREAEHIPLAQGLIFNTFNNLEAPILAQIRTICPNIYAIGPLHAHLKSREARPATSNSIWEEDRSCISWLDKQPSKSVVYVSIGSLAVMTKDQMCEIWHGLVNSGVRFLWVRRPGSVPGCSDETEILSPDQDVTRGTEERGCIVRWAPQEEVLAHPAVGGFLTHSGWNSTLESMVEGKPMICRPYFLDQHVNSRYVEAVWKVGLDMKDSCDRAVVEKMVREVMESRKDEFLEVAEEVAESARAAVSPGGSSFADMDLLIEEIKTMKIAIK
ncbi:7-deoxyloganetic acid glucosyltransferase-like [Salvia hispanica]|uniref:7-deoxyloganetic acid glucosyltransferase-like n=1 Tax=Salvia hispanica TaxID=49212 RepID=UPI002009A2DC|nr:7-deoxyloganetic acid glucosyltransferase-like [Salvia hispanica]